MFQCWAFFPERFEKVGTMFQQLKWHLKARIPKKKKLEPTLKHPFKTWDKQGAMFHMFGGN
jgi:hypothetical protein